VVDLERVPGLRPGDWGWQQYAACRGMGAATFFHPHDERDPARSERVAAAKAICERCPALNECRAYALQFREPYGIWGGLSETERASLLGIRTMRYPGDTRQRVVTETPDASLPGIRPMRHPGDTQQRKVTFVVSHRSG
jgi:WhiB family redox-sensing transcriptional regulator